MNRKTSEDALYDAREMVDNFIMTHRQAAIPAIIAGCLHWSVLNGGSEVMRDTLQGAIILLEEMDILHREAAQ